MKTILLVVEKTCDWFLLTIGSRLARLSMATHGARKRLEGYRW